MTNTQQQLAAIQSFSQRYGYDMSYQEQLLEDSPKAFEAFARAQGTSALREALPVEAHFVARVAIMLAEDCLDCIQVNLRMAIEAGVPRELLVTLLQAPQNLPAELLDLREHAFSVSRGRDQDPERIARLRAAYGEAGLAELAVCLAGCRLFTTAKRSLGKAGGGIVELTDF